MNYFFFMYGFSKNTSSFYCKHEKECKCNFKIEIYQVMLIEKKKLNIVSFIFLRWLSNSVKFDSPFLVSVNGSLCSLGKGGDGY